VTIVAPHDLASLLIDHLPHPRTGQVAIANSIGCVTGARLHGFALQIIAVALP
jgi:hypothetical protein